MKMFCNKEKYMKLIYLWVEEFRNIKQVGFSFSPKFKVEFNFNEKLGCKQIYIEGLQKQRRLFDDKINNVTTIDREIKVPGYLLRLVF